MPLKIGNFVKVIFEGTGVPKPVEGRVVRSCVASMKSSGIRYYIGVAFKISIALEDEAPPQGHAESRPAAVAVDDPPQAPSLVNRW